MNQYDVITEDREVARILKETNEYEVTKKEMWVCKRILKIVYEIDHN